MRVNAVRRVRPPVRPPRSSVRQLALASVSRRLLRFVALSGLTNSWGKRMKAMKERRKRMIVAAGMAAGLAAAAATPASAQDIKIEVTGSNIKRVEGEGAL